MRQTRKLLVSTTLSLLMILCVSTVAHSYRSPLSQDKPGKPADTHGEKPGKPGDTPGNTADSGKKASKTKKGHKGGKKGKKASGGERPGKPGDTPGLKK